MARHPIRLPSFTSEEAQSQARMYPNELILVDGIIKLVNSDGTEYNDISIYNMLGANVIDISDADIYEYDNGDYHILGIYRNIKKGDIVSHGNEYYIIRDIDIDADIMYLGKIDFNVGSNSNRRIYSTDRIRTKEITDGIYKYNSTVYEHEQRVGDIVIDTDISEGPVLLICYNSTINDETSESIGFYRQLTTTSQVVEMFEKQKYYGDINIIPTDESYFTLDMYEFGALVLTDEAKSDETLTDVVVPYKYNGTLVSRIGSFEGNSNIKSIRFPNGVKGFLGFKNCSNLVTVEFGELNTLSVIIGSCFENCTRLGYIEIPDTVIAINDRAFYNCKGLNTVILPDKLAFIYESAFENCSSLRYITIPSSVTEIGANAFAGCTDLIIFCERGSYAEKYAIENGIPYDIDLTREDTCMERIKYYGDAAITPSPDRYFVFGEPDEENGTIAITGLSIEGCLYEDDSYDAAMNGEKKVELVVPYKYDDYLITQVKLSIDDYYTLENGGEVDTNYSITDIILPDSIETISENAFYNMANLRRINIPNNVKEIGAYALAMTPNLEMPRLPDKITNIAEGLFGSSCFYNSLYIEIPNSVTAIGDNAFAEVCSIEILNFTIKIPNSVISIGAGVFGSYIDEDNREVSHITIICDQGSYAERFAKENGINYLYDTINSNELLKIERFQYYGDANIIPSPDRYFVFGEPDEENGTIAITRLSLEGMQLGIDEDFDSLINGETIVEIVVPYKHTIDGIDYIINKVKFTSDNYEDEEYYYESSVTNVILPNSIKIISDRAFSGMGYLREINLPESIIELGEYAFSCTGIESVVFPKNIKIISEALFGGCRTLKYIEIPQGVTSIEVWAFDWAEQENCYVYIPESVTSIDESAFTITEDGSVTEDITFVCSQGSYAETYAKENGIKYMYDIVESDKFIINCIEDSSSPIGIILDRDYDEIKEALISNKNIYIWNIEVMHKPMNISISNIGLVDEYMICQVRWNAIDYFYYIYKDGNLSVETFDINSEIEAERLKRKRLQYYGDASIIPTDVNLFTYTGTGNIEITGVNFDNIYTISYIVIPYEINGYKVTSIQSGAFKGYEYLQQIILPNTITTIGDSAFAACTSLTSVSIPNSVTTIRDRAFYDCTSLTSVNIPNSVTTIGDRAFYDCTSLTSVNIPNSVTTIGEYAFCGCTSLTAVNIPNSVTTIGAYAFSFTSIKSIELPKNITIISEGLFANCNYLTHCRIPKGATLIENEAFWNVSLYYDGDGGYNEFYIEIPSSVESIGELSFGAEPGYGTGEEAELEDTIFSHITFIVEQGSYAETYAKENKIKYMYNTVEDNSFIITSSVDIDGVWSIDKTYDEIKEAVDKNKNISTLTPEGFYMIPSSIEFSDLLCKMILNVGYTIYEFNLSKSDSGEESLVMSAKSINNDIQNLTNAFNEVVGSKMNLLTNNKNTIVESINEVQTEVDEVYLASERLQYYGDANIIPTDISYFTFTTDSNNKTASIVLADTVDMNILTSVVIPYEYTDENGVIYNVTKIKEFAFDVCASLTSVNIPNSVTTIENGAFGDCTSLTSVSIPNSVTTIGNGAFNGCINLTSVNIPNSVTTIGNWAFKGCTSLTSVNIPNSVTTIGDSAFSVCTSLTSVNIPNSVTTIGEYAFSDCINLTSVNIPNSVTTIGNAAFYDCTNLTTVNIPNSVTTIESSVFEGCTSLTSVTIPNSVTTIGNRAFYGCTNLTSVSIPNSVTTIGKDAFVFISYDAGEPYHSIISNLTFICRQGSYAETYAKENGIKYMYDIVEPDKFVINFTLNEETGVEWISDKSSNEIIDAIFNGIDITIVTPDNIYTKPLYINHNPSDDSIEIVFHTTETLIVYVVLEYESSMSIPDYIELTDAQTFDDFAETIRNVLGNTDDLSDSIVNYLHIHKNQNVLDSITSQSGVFTRPNLLVNKTIGKGYIAAGGDIIGQSAPQRELHSDFIEVEPSTNYTIQLWAILPDNNIGSWMCWAQYDENKTYISRPTFSESVTDENGITYSSKTIKTAENCKYLRLSWRSYSSARVKVEKGDYGTPYVLSYQDTWTNVRQYIRNQPVASLILGNGGYVEFNSIDRTMTLPADTLVIYDNDHVSTSYFQIAKSQTVSFDSAYTAYMVVYNRATNILRSQDYWEGMSNTDILICTVRFGNGELPIKPSLTCPYKIDGLLYGLDLNADATIDAVDYDYIVKGINHRGFNSIAPENTLSAFKLSKQKGFKYVECDVSFTSDGVAVLLHDTSIDRTSNGTGEISSLTFDEVRTYDFGSWKNSTYAGEQIPSFEEFISLCRNLGLHPYVELKGGTSQTRVQGLIDTVEKYSMIDKITWISFSTTTLGYVKNADPSARIGYVVDNITDTTITNAIALRTDNNEVFIDCNHGSLTEDKVLLCIQNSIPLEIWTTNTESTIQNLNPYVSGVTSDSLIAGKVLLGDYSIINRDESYTESELLINEIANKSNKPIISHSEDTDPVISLINNHEERFGELSSLTINWFEERPKIYYSLATGEYSETKDEETAGEVYKYISPDGTDIQYLSIGDDIIPTDSEGNYYIKEYENTPLSELNIEDDFITSIIFTSGSTATNLIYPEEILFDGMDCIDNVFTPIPNKRYNVFISYDGQYLIGEVGGVSI